MPKHKNSLPTVSISNKKIIMLKSLEDNLKQFEDIFQGDDSFMARHFACVRKNKSLKFCLLYLDGMVDAAILDNSIIKPIINAHLPDDCEANADIIINQVIFNHYAKKSQESDELLSAIIMGDSVLLIENCYDAVIVSSKGWKSRTPSEPEGEKLIRGPREGFVEPMLDNLALIRRRLATPDLKYKEMTIGVETKTKIGIVYIEGIANKQILAELIERINKVEIDGMVLAGSLAELIQDAPYSPFETIGFTERPDVAVADLLEGRIIVLVDGTPITMTLPYLFEKFFQSGDDYSLNYLFSSFSRLLRMISFWLTITAPAIYVALTTYHQEMIPTALLMSILAAREGVPFPTIVETVGLLVIFEILREAGTRMPISLSNALSILGALVLGTAAVEAKIVSATVITVVALTGLTGLMTQRIKAPIVVIRTALTLLAGFMGLYGILYGTIFVTLHMCSIRSFGVPYMMEFTSLNPGDLRDTALRAPIWFLRHRPKLVSSSNKTRQANRLGQ